MVDLASDAINLRKFEWSLLELWMVLLKLFLGVAESIVLPLFARYRFTCLDVEKNSVFRASRLFVFAAKKEMKYSKIRTAQSSRI